MAVFEAYFDESFSDSGSTIFAVGGAVAKVSQWTSMAVQWERVLRKYGISSFHAADFNTKHGEFGGWPGDYRQAFLDCLFRIIASEHPFGIAVVMDCRDFRKAIEQVPGLLGKVDEYQFLCYMCVAFMAGQYLTRRRVPPIRVFFEFRQNFHSPMIDWLAELARVEDLAKAMHVGSIQRRDKAGVVPFQIADLIAYEQFKAHTRMSIGRPPLPRHQAKALNSSMLGKHSRLDYLSILERLKSLSETFSFGPPG